MKILQDQKEIESTKKWLASFVVDLNLCPFAQRELIQNRIRYKAIEATTDEQLLLALQTELELLNSDPLIETTLLIHANVLQNFQDYNQFLTIAEKLLLEIECEGVYQIASFHPDYQFSGTAPDDVENYTNRSPYPMLHILREDSLDIAIANHPDIAQIPKRNIELMKSMGEVKLKTLLKDCFANKIRKTEIL